MEWCLGVTHHAKVTEARGKELEGEQHPRYDVREADTLMEAEGNDPARLRYRKMFWEAIPDGKVNLNLTMSGFKLRLPMHHRIL